MFIDLWPSEMSGLSAVTRVTFFTLALGVAAMISSAIDVSVSLTICLSTVLKARVRLAFISSGRKVENPNKRLNKVPLGIFAVARITTLSQGNKDKTNLVDLYLESRYRSDRNI